MMIRRISQTDSQGSDEDIEQHFGLQLEQLIEHCKDELILIPQMAGSNAHLLFVRSCFEQ